MVLSKSQFFAEGYRDLTDRQTGEKLTSIALHSIVKAIIQDF